jgi:cysteine-rich repeat protein
VQDEEGEQCDDQVNRSLYNGCAPGCLRAPRCGDGIVQPAHGEQCDLGEDANVGGYDGCLATCRRGPFCGDGVVDAPREECDDKNTNDYDGCSASCRIEGVVF